MSLASALFELAAATPTPSPTPSIPAADITTPGPWGFIAFFGVAVVVLLLIIDMTRRIRRVRYRAEVAEKLDAEQAQRDDDGRA
ncbi:hypothetical protein [Gryllotalpicola protaetiae]|uniref:Heme exporter protein D n=1 Tax=Gryllotalpicola protaetiae TaxID=2419771 RepID=A0A387BNM8_9MICO|nr:hypothetical protein [Gryllotalpicola protaetiae]AYG02596.1 hypothetical protein D7I44_03035 [Gryllotalpicola protaetiae]